MERNRVYAVTQLKWRNINLGKKFTVGFGVVLSLLSIVALWSVFGIEGIVNDATEVISGNKLSGMIAQKEVDHLNWVNRVNVLLTDEKVNSLAVETDDHKCGFGQWLYGHDRKVAESMVPALAPLLKAIEAPHLQLHNSAIAIGNHFKPADSNLPTILLEREIDHLNWAAKIRDALLKGQDRIDVQVDPEKCGLGKWLISPSAQRSYENGDDEFKKIWKEMLGSHKKLHQSAINLQEELDTSSQQAKIYFEQTTLPILAQTVEKLKFLNAKASQALQNKEKANQVYASQTLPALSQVQDLLNQIRQIAKENIMTDAQMLNSAVNTRRGVILFSVIALGIGCLLAFVMARGIITPLKKGVDLAKAVSSGDLTQTIDVDQEDEIGVLAHSMQSMTDNLREIFSNISDGVASLSSSSTELSAISQQMAAGAEQSSNKSASVASSADDMSASMNSVSAATEQASQNVGMVAAAAEEMSATIQEIAHNTERGRTISSEAVSKASSASSRMEELGRAAQEVGTVTETITEISEQTNLLALNATIEAARAGEAGKGFAVVANEIKELAKQTAEATLQIRQRIEGIQNSTSSTVTEIQEVTTVINDVSDVVSTIASAIEEQSVATKEISNNVAQASLGIQEVNENVAQSSTLSSGIATDISEVKGAADENANASSQVHLSAEELSGLSERLKSMVSQFKLS